MSQLDKDKLFNMAKELYMDVTNDIKRVDYFMELQEIKDEENEYEDAKWEMMAKFKKKNKTYSTQRPMLAPWRDRKEKIDDSGFHIGKLMGQVNEKYKMLVEYYRSLANLEPWKTRNTRWLRPDATPNLLCLLYNEMSRRLETEIEGYLDLVDFAMMPDVNTMFRVTPTSTTSTSSPHLRINDEQMKAVEDFILNERAKSRTREQYLLRRMGLPTHGTTPAKRFKQRWPVEDTWDKVLQMYG